MASISWLHISDLHQGIEKQKWMWPAVQTEFFKDLERLHAKAGPWDIVLFTGDLTQTGSKEEFERLDATLGALWNRLEKLGSVPMLLAVPGNHDLVRPPERNPVVRSLQAWAQDENVVKDLFSPDDATYRPLLSRAFEPFSNWYRRWRESHSVQGLEIHDWKEGLLPGDFCVSIKKGGLSLAVTGLNSAFMHLTSGDPQRKLLIHASQLTALQGSPAEWIGGHHASLLLTHHPVDWLHEDAVQLYQEHINPPERFSAHLFGHMHEATSLHSAEGGARPRLYLQGSSLFGLESYGQELKRQHGFSAARLKIGGNEGTLQIWPRKAEKKKAGNWGLSPDTAHDLHESDNSYSLPLRPHRTLKEEAVSNAAVADQTPAVNGPGPEKGVPEPPPLEKIADSTGPDAQSVASQDDSLRVDALENYLRARGIVLGVLDQVRSAAYRLSSNHLANESSGDRLRVEQGPTLAIVGSFSSGKTTFVNALFGQDLLPVSNQPTTAAITEIHASRRSHVGIRLKPEDLLTQEQALAKKRLEELLNQPDPTFDPRKDSNYLSLQRVATLDVGFALKNPIKLTGYRLDRPDDLKVLERFLTDTQDTLTHYVERVQIDFPFDASVLPEGVTLLDTPGANSPFEFHLQATYRALQLSEAVLFFISATATLGAADRELLKDIARIRRAQKVPNNLSKDRFIFIVNAIDQLDAEKGEPEKTLASVSERLENLGIENPIVLGLSSKLALVARKARSGRTLTKKEVGWLQMEAEGDPIVAWDASGIHSVLMAVWTLLGGALGQSILNTGLNRARDRLQQLNSVLEEKVAASHLKPSEIRHKLESIQEKIERKRKVQDGLVKEVKRTYEIRMNGFAEVETLKGMLQRGAALLKDNDDVEGVQITEAIKEWTEDRYTEIQEVLSGVTDRIGRLLANEIEDVDEMRRRELSLPPMQLKPIRFDTLFDLDTGATKKLGKYTGVGMILGGFFGGALAILAASNPIGWAIGALLGVASGGAGADLLHSRARKLRNMWASHLEEQTEERCERVHQALTQNIEDLIKEICTWVERQLKGYLDDLENQLRSLERISREADEDRPRVTAHLVEYRIVLTDCRERIDTAEMEVQNLIASRDALLLGEGAPPCQYVLQPL